MLMTNMALIVISGKIMKNKNVDGNYWCWGQSWCWMEIVKLQKIYNVDGQYGINWQS